MTQAPRKQFDGNATGRSSRRSSKRDAILDVGARLMNDEGAGGVRLSDIADQLGLSRNALYYYVKDRADLVRQCYIRSCETIESDLKAVVAAQPEPREQIALFIAQTLQSDRPQRAVLADIDILEQPYCEQLQSRCDTHVVDLSNILKAGQAKGVFKGFDPEIASYALLGMMSWSLLWTNWLTDNEDTARTKRQELIVTIQNLFFHGLRSRDGEDFVCKFDYASLTHQNYNVFDRSDANLLRQSQLIAAASLLFNRRGLDGASIEAIAEAVGASKGAIYHHFQDKADLVERCYERAFKQYEMIIDRTEASGAGPLDILLSVLHLNCQAQANSAPPLALQPGLTRLPKHYLDRSNTITSKMRAALESAVKTGSIENDDPEIVSVSAGAFFWIQKWRQNHPKPSPMEIADQMTTLIKSGICAVDTDMRMPSR